jgi:hypothetical protein
VEAGVVMKNATRMARLVKRKRIPEMMVGGLLSSIATGKVKTTGYAIQRSVPEGSPYSLAVAEYT